MTEEELELMEKAMEADSLELTILCDRREEMTRTETLLAAAFQREMKLIAEWRKMQKAWAKYVVDATETEREACAKIAENEETVSKSSSDRIAAAIRARGGQS